jgi:ABC-type transport system involved in multi-copper enzyme maturation permease subunit
MTTVTIDPTPAQRIDLSATPRIPLSRLVRVELRKMANTRSGKWLLVAIGLITLLIVGIFFATAEQSERTFFNFVATTAGPQGFLLPVLGILLITSEWTQRSGLVSFTLMPVRSRVLLAKILAGLIAGGAAIALSVVLAALATLVGGADNAWAQFGLDDLGKFGILQVTGVLQGLAFGLLFLNSSPAIVSYFVLPTAFNILGSLWRPLGEVQPWIDLWTSQAPLFTGAHITGEQWAQIGTSNLPWVVLPFLLGLTRVLRAEVK